jgi:hypothetical protein
MVVSFTYDWQYKIPDPMKSNLEAYLRQALGRSSAEMTFEFSKL